MQRPGDEPEASDRQSRFAAPVQVDRDAVRSTVFAWLTAGGAPGRIAVVFAGTETDGIRNSGNFKASWDIYVNQSLNALAADATFSQVKVTTHPSITTPSVSTAGCDLAVPPGDARWPTSSRSTRTPSTSVST